VYYLGDALWNDVWLRMRSLRNGSDRQGGGRGGRRTGSGTVAVEVGGDVVDVADLKARGAVHRPAAGVERRLWTSTLHRKLELAAAATYGGAVVEVVVGRHRQTTSNLVAVATARLHAKPNILYM